MNNRHPADDRPGDLWGQLESLFNSVYACERQWRLDDRFDAILRTRPGAAGK